MIAEELMKKYNYGYVHSCELLGEAFVKDLLKENRELKKQLKKTKRSCDFVDLNEMVENLEKENQELKKHLKVPEICDLKTLEDYKSYYEDTKREQILADTYIEYCAYVNLAHRYSELKKQLEDKTEDYRRMKDNFDSKVDILTEIDIQQKEFINYLEDEIYNIEPKGTSINYNCEYDSEEEYIEAMKEQSKLSTLKEILQKYKEIIGVSDEHKTKI